MRNWIFASKKIILEFSSRKSSKTLDFYAKIYQKSGKTQCENAPHLDRHLLGPQLTLAVKKTGISGAKINIFVKSESAL